MSESPPTRKRGRAAIRRSTTIEHIANDFFDAALMPETWPSVLEHLRQAVGAAEVDLHLHSNGAVTARHVGGIAQAALDEYLERFLNREPRSLALARRAPGTVLTDDDIVDRATLRRHAFFTDFLRRHGLGHCIIAMPVHEHGHRAYFGLNFAYGADPPAPAVVDSVRRIQPQLARALGTQLRLGDLAARRDLFASALDDIHTGVIFLDGKREILFFNEPARRFIDDQAITRVENNRPCLVDAASQARFERLCGAAAARRDGAGGALLLRDADGRARYSLQINPTSVDIRERTAAVVLVLVAPLERRRDGLPRQQRMRELFSLTGAEARLADCLLQGHALKDIARSHGITYESARFTLRQIYAKAGVHRQAELVALLAACIGGMIFGLH